MSADTIFADASADMLIVMGESVTFHGLTGDISTRALFVRETAVFGYDASIPEARHEVTFASADVADPQPGDTITRADGTTWVIETMQTGTDDYFETWSTRAQ